MRWLAVVYLVTFVALAPATAATMTTTMPTAFGSVHVGAPKTLTLTITNTDSTGASMAFTVASNSGEFVPSVTAGSLAPGVSQNVTITFTPTARGARTATLTVSTPDDASNPSDTYNLAGTGTSPNMVVTWTGSPSALDFGAVAIAGGTSTRTITIANPTPANESLTFSLAVSTGAADFAAPSTIDVVVPVDTTAQVTITFDPSTSGTRNGSVLVTGDDAFNANDTVALTGMGQGAVFTASPTSLDFGTTVLVGTFLEKTLTITNNGNQSGQVTAITPGNSTFTATPVGPALPRTLAPGDNLEVTVRFTPVDGAAVSSNLAITTNATPASFQVPVTGDGLYKAVSIVATNEPDLMIDLGERRVGVLVTQVVTVTNTGETPQNLALPTSNATQCTIMPISPATLPATLGPGEAATFEIRVTPSAVGVGSCTITVTTNVPSTDTVVVDWQGVASQVVVTAPAASMINFGVIDVDADSTIRTVVLANTGGAPLTIGPCTITGSARFSMLTSCTNLSVAPNASATLMVGFDPTIEAAESATLTIGVDALATSQVMIALSGVGADQRLDLSALSVSFPDANVSTSEMQTAYIDIFNPVNPATGVAETLHISAATTDSKLDNNPFDLANEGPFTVEGGKMIRLAITFQPPIVGVYDGALTIISDASGQPMAVIALHGRGVIDGADESGGCCQAGGEQNAPLAVVLLLLFARRRRSVRRS
jgi:hypothetical protein